MNGSWNGDSGAWVPLQEYFGAQLEGLEAEIKRLDQLRTADQVATSTALSAAKEAVAAALAAADKANEKSERSQQRVNEGQNEFRATLKDQAATLMPRNETENLVRELRTLISDLADDVSIVRSRIDVGPPSLGALQAESDRRGGREGGTGDTWKTVLAIALALFSAFGVIGVIITIIGIITAQPAPGAMIHDRLAATMAGPGGVPAVAPRGLATRGGWEPDGVRDVGSDARVDPWVAVDAEAGRGGAVPPVALGDSTCPGMTPAQLNYTHATCPRIAHLTPAQRNYGHHVCTCAVQAVNAAEVRHESLLYEPMERSRC